MPMRGKNQPRCGVLNASERIIRAEKRRRIRARELWNAKVTVMSTATASPFNIAGWYFQRRTASTAACRSTAGPESNFVETTIPAGLIEACNTTLPAIPEDFAMEG